MAEYLEIVITLIISAAVIAAVWLIYGRMVIPVRAGKGQKLYAIIHAQGAAPDLGSTVEGFLWLISSGRVHMQLIIADGGLDGESRKMAEILAREHSEISLCALADLTELIGSGTEEGCCRKEALE
ncbi:MAG: hypothetical protein GX250_08015 [Clostridiales bacterium]|jgi:hypothetical protein|nr:hypothetical protein [Clostridiales bacterium]